MSLDAFLNRQRNIHNFSPETSIGDLSGKVIVVTGGNAGLGLESIIQLAAHNPHKIYMTARSQAKYDTAMTEIRKHVATADKIVHFIEMDLASFESVKKGAEQLLASTNRIDILINNAGIMGAAPGVTTSGYEIHFGTNHMGPALFTKLLMPVLLKTAETSSDVRIVIVSSGAYQMGLKTGFDANLVKTDMAKISTMGDTVLPRYGQTKLANVLFARALAKHYPTITSVAIAPGRVKTGLLDGMYAGGHSKVYAYFQKFYDVAIGGLEPAQGAYTQVWAATEANKERIENGFMYSPIGTKDAPIKFTKDDEYVDKLWEFTESELRLKGY